MVESDVGKHHELLPENSLSFLEFIEKIETWFKRVKPSLNTESVRALDDEPLIGTLLYAMEYIEIELARNSDEDSMILKRHAEHVTQLVKLLLRKDSSNAILQNSADLLIEALQDFKYLDHVLIDENFVKLQELGKIDLSRITNIIY